MAFAAERTLEMGCYQMWLSVLGIAGLLATIYYTASAALAARDSAKVAESALHSVERAFVFNGQTNVETIIGAGGRTAEWVFTPQWTNSGATPTRFATNHVSYGFFPIGTGPESVNFEDRWGAGMRRDTSRIFLAPKGAVWAQFIRIPIAEFRPNQVGFIWGWVEYGDIFDRWHRTEFCLELEPRSAIDTPDWRIMNLRLYRLYNGSDEAVRRTL